MFNKITVLWTMVAIILHFCGVGAFELLGRSLLGSSLGAVYHS